MNLSTCGVDKIRDHVSFRFFVVRLVVFVGPSPYVDIVPGTSHFFRASSDLPLTYANVGLTFVIHRGKY